MVDTMDTTSEVPAVPGYDEDTLFRSKQTTIPGRGQVG